MDDPKITLDPADFAESTDVTTEAEQQDTATSESSPEETTEPVTEESQAETESDEQPQEEAPADETPPEEPQYGKAEQRKDHLNTEIRDLVARRNELQRQVREANDQVYQPASQQQLEDQGLSATDAKIEALRQQVELQDYNQRVADTQFQLESESQRIMHDFPMFDDRSDQYKPEIAQAASELLAQSLVYDQNTGQIIGANASPYQLYKTIAQASNTSAVQGEIEGQRNSDKLAAAVDAPSSVPPKEPKIDPFLAGLTGGLNLGK